MNHVSSCPFLPANVGVQRLKEASYSDIDIRSSSKSSTSETSPSDGSSSSGSSTSDSESEENVDNEEGKEAKDKEMHENMSLKSNSSLVQRQRSSLLSESKYKTNEKSKRKNVKLHSEMKKDSDKNGPQVQIVSRSTDGRAIVKIIRKSASQSFSAESIADENGDEEEEEDEDENERQREAKRAALMKKKKKKKKKRKKKKKQDTDEKEKEKKKRDEKCSCKDARQSETEHSIVNVACVHCSSYSKMSKISHDATHDGPNAHIDSVPGASSKFPVSSCLPLTVPIAANSSSASAPLPSPASVSSFNHVHSDNKSKSQTAKLPSLSSTSASTSTSSSSSSSGASSSYLSQPASASSKPLRGESESSCSFWPASLETSSSSTCASKASRSNVPVFPSDSHDKSKHESRKQQQSPDEKSTSGRASTRSSNSLRRAFFADLTKSPETLVEEEEEFAADECKVHLTSESDARQQNIFTSDRQQQSSRDDDRYERSREGQASGVNKFIPRVGLKEQFDIEMGSSDAIVSTDNTGGDSPSRVSLIPSTRGVSSSSSSLAWAKPSGIRAFFKASFRSSKSQSVDVTMIPEIDSSDEKSASSATSTPIHSARLASESSHLLPSTSAGASSSSTSSSSAIAKRGKRMKSVKSLQSPVTCESIPLPVVSTCTSNAYTSYQASASAGIHPSSGSSVASLSSSVVHHQQKQQQQPHTYNPQAHSRSQQVTSPSSLPLSPSPSPSTSMSGSGLRLGGSHSSSSIKRRSPSASMSKRRASSAATVVSITGPGASSSATVMSLPRPSVGSLAHSPSAGKRFL